MNQKQVVLVIFDGWGLRDEAEGNAIKAARKPYYDYLWQTYPHTSLCASGGCVGLPAGEMGNSEVGHLTIGAGTPADTDIVRINKSIEEKKFSQNEAIKRLFSHVKKYNSVLHVQGLVSLGGVHSHTSHLIAFLQSAAEFGVKNVAIHVFTDGRDTPPQSAIAYLKELEAKIDQIGIGYIASISGRYYAMDRDNNWDRTAKVADLLFECQGNKCQKMKPSEYIQSQYDNGKTDEYLEPTIFPNPLGKIVPLTFHDGVFFFNFRSDRARQISRKISEQVDKKGLCFVTMTEYEKNDQCLPAFPPQKITVTLASEIARAGLSQSHIAETEKYAHVTYFFNGGNEEPFANETRFLIESRKDVKTHDQAPEMRAWEIAQKAAEEIEKGVNFTVLNFANPDMVGHTANFASTVKAIESVDKALKLVVQKALEKMAVVFITSDHGNAEIEIDPKTKQPFTSHTSSDVPAIITLKNVSLKKGGLCDVAPTILELFAIPKPSQMSGNSLLVR